MGHGPERGQAQRLSGWERLRRVYWDWWPFLLLVAIVATCGFAEAHLGR